MTTDDTTELIEDGWCSGCGLFIESGAEVEHDESCPVPHIHRLKGQPAWREYEDLIADDPLLGVLLGAPHGVIMPGDCSVSPRPDELAAEGQRLGPETSDE